MYDAGNHLLVCAEYQDPDLHRHRAAHIMISLDDKIDIITKHERIPCRGIAIPSGVAHTANTGKNRVLIFLFDNTSNIANQIKDIMVISDEAVEKIKEAYSCFENSNELAADYHKFVKCVYQYTNLCVGQYRVPDKRIESALLFIQSNLQEPITCGDAAKHVFLSEGRFSHLFREQVGMTFSAYLICQRVMRTYAEVINGKSITEAAIEAGFSSSTHFAETNKKLFGLPASAVKKNLAFYKIAEI